MRGDSEIYGVTVADLFQSTPLREGRHFTKKIESDYRNFNPRPCVRGDFDGIFTGDYFTISIHAPA